MDGQVKVIRQALDAAGYQDIPILAYSAKFALALYGPFRDAGGTSLMGDRNTYQMNPMNRREAVREALADEAEGADALMVKPAGAYLDIIREIRDASMAPLAAYQVSGEFAMVRRGCRCDQGKQIVSLNIFRFHCLLLKPSESFRFSWRARDLLFCFYAAPNGNFDFSQCDAAVV
jgi:delta-aminolevulinic acid dehydratase/porphobilinogen synthase